MSRIVIVILTHHRHKSINLNYVKFVLSDRTLKFMLQYVSFLPALYKYYFSLDRTEARFNFNKQQVNIWSIMTWNSNNCAPEGHENNLCVHRNLSGRNQHEHQNDILWNRNANFVLHVQSLGTVLSLYRGNPHCWFCSIHIKKLMTSSVSH
jgi:hypothetical protein